MKQTFADETKENGSHQKTKKRLQLKDMDMQQHLQIFIFKTIRAF